MSIPGIPSASTASNNTSTTTAGQQTSITPSPRSYQSPPPNTPTGPSSSSSTRNKLEQIIQNFYTKTAQVIIQARVQSSLTASGRRRRSSTSSTASIDRKSKLNRWFNLATSESLRDELKYWQVRATQAMDEEPPPLILDIYLDVSRLTSSQILVLAYDRSRRLDISDSTKRILLERWTLSLRHPLPTFSVDLPNLYKRSIVFFRALYTYIRLLPCHDLYRRLQQYGASDALDIGYRMSADPLEAHTTDEEVDLDMSILEGADDLRRYEFSDIVTPLGSFKLQVQYRNVCDFCVEDSERDLSARMIGIDEHFFTPTVERHRQEQVRHEETSRPSSRQMSDFLGSRDIIQRQQRPRQPSVGLRDLSDGMVIRGSEQFPPTTDMIRRVSAPHISPFKSHSLSSSPQAAEYYGGRGAQGLSADRTQQHHQGGSAPARTKIEFSSSFDKIRDRTTPTSPMTRRWSRTSDHSLIPFDTEDASLREFVQQLTTNKSIELKMFQKYDTAMADSANLSPTSETSSSLGSIYRSKKALSHFRALKETNTTLSESMSSSMMGRSSAAERGEGAGHSFGSSTSSTGRSYLPVVPSPLHTENTNVTTTTSKPMHIPSSHGTQYRSTDGERQGGGREVVSSAVYGTPSSNTSRHQSTPEDDQRYPAFSTYPQDRHHDEMRRLCTVEQHPHHDGNNSKQHCNDPPPPTPSSPKRPESVTSITTGGHRTSIVDDDDSLVFKMSELSGEQQQQQQIQPPRPLLEDETFGPLTEAATRDYARRLGINTDLVGSHPVNSSSTSIPPQSPMATVVEEEEKSTTATSSSSTSSSSNIKHHQQQQQHHHHHHHHIF